MGFFGNKFRKFSKGIAVGMAALSMLAMPLSANAASVQSYGGANIGANNVPVTVNYNGTSARAMIPKSISFTTKTGEYDVKAYCETSKIDTLDSNVSIVPSSTFTLTKSGTSETITATVSQEKTTFTPGDIRNGSNSTVQITSGGTTTDTPVKMAAANGTITANGVTAGTWTGTMVFTVS